MSTPPNASNSGPAAAVPVGGQPNRRKWLLPLLLGLLALIALLFLLSRCGNDDPATPTAGTSASPTAAASTAATTTDSASASPSATAGETGGAQDGQSGAVTSGDDNLLAAGGGAGTAASLREHDGQQAVGRVVRVLSVPADEGFWVGTSAQERLWVQLTGTRGESDYKVKEGDTVEFTGTVTPAAKGFAAEVGVTAAEGAEQLTSQGYYVAVPASSVKLSN